MMRVLIFLSLTAKMIYTSVVLSGSFTWSMFFMSIVTAIVLWGLAYSFGRRRHTWTLIGIDGIVSGILFADLLYFKYFSRPLSVYAFLQTKNIGGLGASIESLWSWQEWVVWLDAPLIVGLLLFGRRLSSRTSSAPVTAKPFPGQGASRWLFPSHASLSRPFKMLVLSMLVIGFLFFLMRAFPFSEDLNVARSQGAFQDAPSPSELTKNSVAWLDNPREGVRLFGAIGHHVVDTLYYWKEDRLDVSEADREAIRTWFREHAEAGAFLPSAHHGEFQGMNLLLIQVESLQNFTIGRDVQGQALTPNLNRMLEHAYYFPAIYPQTIEGNSSDAELLTQTGLYPAAKGSSFYRFDDHTYPSLAKLLAEEGYDILAMHGDRASYWNRDRMFPTLGLHDFYDLSRLDADEMIGMGLSDRSLFRQLVDVLKERTSPFYAFVITLSTHMPFIIPEGSDSLSLDVEEGGAYAADYLKSVHYFDQTLRELLERLDEAGLLESTVIVLYGDHDGLLQKDSPSLEKALNLAEIDDETWLTTFQPIPLVIYHPSIEGKTFSTVGGQVDILPTIFELMGISEERYNYFAMGKNLFSADGGYAVLPGGDYADRAWITPDGVTRALPEEVEGWLNLADLIHRADYFAENK
ncbi:MAG: sulfatase-like hydrolase/transferase [Candidatus Carbobacillus altaicus]|nr:sulfatase-like hydrolase/transferase [Candidatus Carbobacillus altaicus]